MIYSTSLKLPNQDETLKRFPQLGKFKKPQPNAKGNVCQLIFSNKHAHRVIMRVYT